GLVEFTVAAPAPAALPDKFPLRGEHLQAIVAAVDDDQVAVLFDRETRRPKQFAVAAAGAAPLAQEFAAAAEHRYLVRPIVRDVEMIVVIDRAAERPSTVSFARAEFAKVGEPLLLTRCTELHFIDVHSKIVLVAAIGRVQHAVSTEAHRLNIVEPRAA